MSVTPPTNTSALRRLLANTRFYVLLFSVVLSGVVYQWSVATIPDAGLRGIRLEQVYGFTAVIFLYIALLATPLLKLFPSFPGRGTYMHARRAIGVSAFYFAALHVCISFFGQLQGFAGIGFLSGRYVTALLLGLAGLVVLFLMAATSFDYAITKLTFPRWKKLHRLVYPAGLVILLHIVMIGTHFSALNQAIPRVLVAGLAILLLLEAIRFDKFLRAKWPGRAAGPVVLVSVIAVGFGLLLSYLWPGASSGGGASGLNVHSQHVQIARNAQNAQSVGGAAGSTAALAGDPNKRYTVSFNHDDAVVAGQETRLGFELFDASSGSTDFNLQPLYTKLAHLVIVDDSLTYFQHIHPLPAANITDLAVTTTFPRAGNYRLYLSYQPSGAIEQQVGFSLTVGNPADSPGGEAASSTSTQPVDKNLTKKFGDYTVKLRPANYSARKFTLGQQKLSFSLYDKAGAPVTNLRPYLGAFGHLVLVEQTTHEYVHVHPYSLRPLEANASGGPTVEFLPIGLYGPIKPGTYRVFAEFNPNNTLITADFTIRITP